jgi:hypothetical protein
MLGRPTSNIGSTIAYRGLRQYIAIDPHRPANLDLSAEFRTAWAWLRELAAEDTGGSSSQEV